MPHWGSGMQSLVNGWIKINIKNTSHSDDKESEGRQSSDVPTGESAQGRASRSTPRKGEHVSHTTSTTTASTLDVEDPETMAIRRFNNRRPNGRRRLQRTVSHSDLIREMAKEMALEKERAQKEARTEPSASETTKVHPPNDESIGRSLEASNSLRLAAGFFGTNASDGEGAQNQQQTNKPLSHESKHALHPTPQRLPLPPTTTGKYLNEAAFVQQLEQTKARHHRTSSAGTSGSEDSRRALRTDALVRARHDTIGISIDSGPTPPLFKGSSREIRTGNYDDILHMQHLLSTNGIANDPDLQQRQHQANSAVHSVAKADCPGCDELQRRLSETGKDVEHLRRLALRLEHTCASCEERKLLKGKSSLWTLSNHDSASMHEASKRIMDVTAESRRQIERMTHKERPRWQTDMQLKLSKLTMTCKQLNEESAIRKQESLLLKSQLVDVEVERDNLATEVQQLRSQVAQHELEKAEQIAVKEMLTSYETRALDGADEAIRQRDRIIAELSVRLEHTMETLTIERQQQRQRRQIIFPVPRTLQQHQSSPSMMSTSDNVTVLNEELKRAREATKIAEAMVAVTKAEAAQNEMALMARCEQLEKLLKASSDRTNH